MSLASALSFIPTGISVSVKSGIYFSNELLDAFPVHRVVMNDEGLSEFYVDCRCEWRVCLVDWAIIDAAVWLSLSMSIRSSWRRARSSRSISAIDDWLSAGCDETRSRVSDHCRLRC